MVKVHAETFRTTGIVFQLSIKTLLTQFWQVTKTISQKSQNHNYLETTFLCWKLARNVGHWVRRACKRFTPRVNEDENSGCRTVCRIQFDFSANQLFYDLLLQWHPNTRRVQLLKSHKFVVATTIFCYLKRYVHKNHSQVQVNTKWILRMLGIKDCDFKTAKFVTKTLYYYYYYYLKNDYCHY